MQNVIPTLNKYSAPNGCNIQCYIVRVFDVQ